MNDPTVRAAAVVSGRAFYLGMAAQLKWVLIGLGVVAVTVPLLWGGGKSDQKQQVYETGRQLGLQEKQAATPAVSPSVPIPIIQPQVSQSDIDRQITAMAVWDQQALADWISWCAQNNSGINQEYGSRLNCLAIEAIKQQQPIKP